MIEAHEVKPSKGGSMKKYFALHPSVFKLDGGAMFGIIPKPLWSKAIPADELNRIQLSLRVMLVQTAHKNILIDTGIGDYHGDKFDGRFGVEGEKNPLIKILKEKFSLDPEMITDLIMTHLHFDHVGGLGHTTAEHTEVFPKATLHVHRQHYDYSLHPTQRDAGSFHSQYFKPLLDKAEQEKRIHWLEGEEGVILEDGSDKIFFRTSQGHTPWLVHPYDEKFIYMADLVPTSHHIPIPWVMGYDIAPGVTTENKMDIYQFISQKKLTMIFEHDMEFWGAKISAPKREDVHIDQKFKVNGLQSLELTFD
jgi:glyoxylase-like metal-dependent hydrolase (beta-lactamase superfamily II)